MRLIRPLSALHTKAGFRGKKAYYEKELGQSYEPPKSARGQPLNTDGIILHRRSEAELQVLQDARAEVGLNEAPPVLGASGWAQIDEGDTAAGPSTAPIMRIGQTVTYNAAIPWCMQPYLNGLDIEVPLPNSKATKKEQLITIRQTKLPSGASVVHRIQKGKTINPPLVPSDIALKHPGSRPSDGHCWFVFKGPHEHIGKFVRPIRLMAVEGEGEDAMAWIVVHVERRGKGKPDLNLREELVVQNRHLLVLAADPQWKTLDEPFTQMREKSRAHGRKGVIKI